MADRPEARPPAGAAGTDAPAGPETIVGGGQVLLVAAAAAAVVLGAALATALLPADVQALIFNAPVIIGLLVVVTGIVLWRAARR